MALDPNALVSSTEARTYLGVDAKDKPADAWLEQVIGGLSLRVLQHTGRTYINPVGEDKAGTSPYTFNPADRELEIDNCRDLSLVEANATPQDDDTWEEVGEELYVAEPLGGPVFDTVRFLTADTLPAQGVGWGLLGLHASSSSVSSESTAWPHQVRAELASRVGIRVTGKLGYGPDLKTVPENVKLAVLMWLQNIHKRDIAFFGESAKVTSKIGMPEDVKELLDGEAATRASVVAV